MFIERIQRQDSPYLLRIHLTPQTRWGKLYFHIFYRGDGDKDPHDHPWDFWTFPLRPYWEEVSDFDGFKRVHVVTRFKWHLRPAEYRHRVLRGYWIKSALGSKAPGHWYNTTYHEEKQIKIFTFIWCRPKRREWGFWVTDDAGEPQFVHWKDYTA